ncbi:MAG: glutamate synthase subunit alpha, partial [Rothia sp. (in: high G+C Gram-positive bacteria)]|nr:glutamate synthase subunit alpha [Rothia sp. (in: high G+C Gram-positive bacteria)]
MEKDACGLALVATLNRQPEHQIVQHALTALRRLEHRGAVGADEGTGDGAGILLQIPDEFFRAVVDFELPPAGKYAMGTAFLPTEGQSREELQEALTELAHAEGLSVLGWREVPIVEDLVGAAARAVMPDFVQMFIAESPQELDPFTGHIPVINLNQDQERIQLDQKAFRVRKRAQHKLGIYFPSFSTRTTVYKGMLTTAQLELFFPDLSDPRFTTKLAIVHSRFSTNTFPSWPLAQPFRTIAHNGEINTVKGNR